MVRVAPLRAPATGLGRWTHGVGVAAAAFPIALFLPVATAHGEWLDAGILVAAADGLGIAHPPGHPLPSLFTKLVMLLLPIGSLELRASVASALAAAGAPPPAGGAPPAPPRRSAARAWASVRSGRTARGSDSRVA
ncbi:MAG: DUF2723 domain-containing protein, partial [Myxococcota bacterium]|nr:DUF2723 domain-containing protein [Myxococcota bacterium]